MVTDTRFPLIDGGRYTYGFELPDEVVQHPSIQQLEKLTKEFIIMSVYVLQVIKDEADQQ